MDLSIILSVIGIISPFILAAVWMTTLITKISNKALLLEITVNNHNDKIINLEAATSYSSIEKVVEKVCYQVFNSKQFKDSMKEPIETAVQKSVKDTLLHIERNRSISQSSAFDAILDEIRRIHIDLTHNKS